MNALQLIQDNVRFAQQNPNQVVQLNNPTSVSTSSNTLITVDSNFEKGIVGSIVEDINASIKLDFHRILGSFQQSLENFKVDVATFTKDLDKVDWGNIDSIVEGLKPVLDLLKPVLDFAKDNPWVFLPLLIPAIDGLLVWMGFAQGGIAAHSIAASLQAWIGNVPKGSLFSLLQSHGAGGFAAVAFDMGQMFITIAVALTAIYKLLVQTGAVDVDRATQAIESGWDKAVNRFEYGTGAARTGKELQTSMAQQSMWNLSKGGWIGKALTALLLLNGTLRA